MRQDLEKILKTELKSLMESVESKLIPEIESAVIDLTMLFEQLLLNPTNTVAIKQDIEHVYNRIDSIQALGRFEVSKKVRAAWGHVFDFLRSALVEIV